MSAWPSRLEEMTSFDGGSRSEARVLRPDRYRFWDTFPADHHFIARGGGYSYAAASFGAGSLVIDHGSFDRVLDFDSDTGCVQVEAGIDLGALYEFLYARGWYLPTQPGYPRITAGGCIAAEIHGKNQLRDGCFSAQVVSLELFHPRHGMLQLSRERDPDIFELTCGGLGLTGCIVTAVLQARRVPDSAVTLRTEALDDVRALPQALRRSAATADFVYSWHDFNNSPRGAGFVASGQFEVGAGSQRADCAGASARADLRSQNRGALPFGMWNRMSASLATALYRRTAMRSTPSKLPLFDSLFPLVSRGGPYFRLFGARGLCEFQAIVPEARFAEFAEAVLSHVRRRRVAITLASAKLFGGEQRDLRFSGAGVCFALDFPRGGGARGFLEFLDRLVVDMSLLPNLIKDSRLPAEVARNAYPQFTEFRRRLREFDPERRCRSELSERLGL